MLDRKEYIVEKAFEVFMAKGYDSVSMTVLHKELNMSRGAMYRYFESKDALFQAVIDRYFFNLGDMFRPIKNSISLSEKIEQTYESIKKVNAYFDKVVKTEVLFLNYTALIIQAAKRYPGFLERLKISKSENLKHWQFVLRNSMEKGEIRKDLNVKITALLFSKSAIFDDPDKPGATFTKSAEESKKTMNYIYSLIKT